MGTVGIGLKYACICGFHLEKAKVSKWLSRRGGYLESVCGSVKRVDCKMLGLPEVVSHLVRKRAADRSCLCPHSSSLNTNIDFSLRPSQVTCPWAACIFDKAEMLSIAEDRWKRLYRGT